MANVRCVSINNDLDIVTARVEARNLARQIGFGIIDQARIATVVSELARNIVLYAEHGRMTLNRLNTKEQVGIEILCEDEGKGIENVDLVLERDCSTMRGEGMGLPGAKRLMDEFEIRSELGVGTMVRVCKWLR
jgi:serine/threonine-protein kinase RsbT